MRDVKAFVRERLRPLALPPARDHKIVEEWAAQLEDAYDALRGGGLTDEEAWARLQEQMPDWDALGRELLDAEPVLTRLTAADLGPLTPERTRRVVAACREMLTSGLPDDLRTGVRLLLRDRGFSAAVVLTLAICLGANAAVFTVVHAVLLRPLPIPDADRIVAMGDVYPTVTPNDVLSNDVPSYFDRLETLTTLDDQAMFTFWFDIIAVEGVAEELRGMRATPSLFRLLRVPPALGRTFVDAEGEPGAEHRVILSHGLWQRLYGGDPTAIGRTLRLGWTGQPYTIVGVMPPGFSFFYRGYDGHARAARPDVQFWIPLAFTPAQKSDGARTRYGFFHVGRLKPGATVERLQTELDAVTARTVARFPEFRLAELGMYTRVTPLRDALTGEVRGTLYLLWAAAGFVLLIGAINIGNLARARSSVRLRELATRLALGAGRFRLTRQLVVEGLVLAGVGAAAAVGVGAGFLETLTWADMDDLPNATHVELNGTVVVFVGIAAGVVGVLLGLVPAASADSVSMAQALADGSRSGTQGRAARWFRRGLVVTQVAVSVVLLIGAALLLASFRNLLGVDAGFTAERVTTATIFPPPSRYPDVQAVVALSNRLLDRLRAIPGVEAAGMTSNIALSGFASPAAVVPADRPLPPGVPAVTPSVVAITPEYFEAMGTPLVRGRYVAESDRQGTLPVVIIDERLAVRLWPDEDPIGKALYRGDAGPYTVVGVVGDVRFEAPAAQAGAIGTAYFPHGQAPPLGRLRWIAIKTLSDGAEIVRAVRTVLEQIDPNLALSDIQTMTERRSRALRSQTLAAALASVFGLVALLLSVVGIHGVLAYLVARRTREIGIRMAFGSSVRGIFHLVFGEGLTLVGLGLLFGLAGAVALGRTLEAQLFGVRPTEPAVLATVALVTGGVALLACVAPAVRATRIDPTHVLTEP